MPEGGYNWDTTKATKKGLSNIKRQAASYNLDQIVRAGQQDKDYKGGISSADRVIADMSKKNQDFINRNRRKDGSLNSAALALLNSRWDERSDYQRDLNKFIKSSPEAKDAYLERFPVGGRINLGIPAAFNALSNLAIPAPIRALGTIVRDVAGLGGRGLKGIIPKGMRKDLGSEWQRLKSNFPHLTNEQDKLLNIQIEEGKGKDVDIKEQIEKGFHDDTSWQDEILKESGLVSDEGDENVIDWSEYTQKFQGQPGYDEEYEERRDTQYMPNVPINQAGKEDYLRQLIGGEISPGNVDQLYDYARRKESEGQTWDQESRQWQEKPTAGTFDLSAQNDIFDVGGNQEQLDEVREQIDWNTANQPLGTSYWEQPELTEDFIKENLITGTDLFRQNQGGYLKKYDDGGYANMSTFEKLKAINDSIAED